MFLKSFRMMTLATALCISSQAAESDDFPRSVSEPIPEAASATTIVPVTPDIKNLKKKNELPIPVAPDIPAPNAEIVPNAAAEEVDLISDKPEAVAKEKEKKKPELLEVIETPELLNKMASQAYVLIGEMKTHLDKTAQDLDDGGKEVTRLLRTTDALAKSITDLVAVWPENEKLKDDCSEAKRNVLVLNDELSRIPRHWVHVRWAFNDSVKSVRLLRRVARVLADAESKLTPLLGKDGKPRVDKEGNLIYVEPSGPPIDPRVAKDEQKSKEQKAVLERMKKAAEARNAKQGLPIDIK